MEYNCIIFIITAENQDIKILSANIKRKHKGECVKFLKIELMKYYRKKSSVKLMTDMLEKNSYLFTALLKILIFLIILQ